MDGLDCFDGVYQRVSDVPESLRVLYHERGGRVVLRPLAELRSADERAALERLRARCEVARAPRRRFVPYEWLRRRD